MGYRGLPIREAKSKFIDPTVYNSIIYGYYEIRKSRW